MIGELARAEIDELLGTEQLGRIGYQADGRTHIVPVSYVYDGESVYALSTEGAKIRAMRENPRVCFEVEHVERWYNWRSAIVWGTFEELHGDDAERAYTLIHSRFTPLIEFESRGGPSGEPSPPHVAAKQFVLYRIHVEERAGRFARL
jgi:nitroimidazol reductase NimA-like FMN-containing flavoprotein (pyridoxamine 5'-phosphate oxidase superfamily)